MEIINNIKSFQKTFANCIGLKSKEKQQQSISEQKIDASKFSKEKVSTEKDHFVELMKKQEKESPVKIAPFLAKLPFSFMRYCYGVECEDNKNQEPLYEKQTSTFEETSN